MDRHERDAERLARLRAAVARAAAAAPPLSERQRARLRAILAGPRTQRPPSAKGQGAGSGNESA